MISRFSRPTQKTIATMTTGGRYPKVVFLTPQNLVITNQEEELDVISYADGDSSVIEPSFNVEETLGLDFDTFVFTGPSPIVLKRRIPSPNLLVGGMFSSSHPVLVWTGGFEVPTIVYRTDVYVTGIPSSVFYPIAKIKGSETPGTNVSYVDTSISLTGDSAAVSYFVKNVNGVSNSVEFIGESV